MIENDHQRLAAVTHKMTGGTISCIGEPRMKLLPGITAVTIGLLASCASVETSTNGQSGQNPVSNAMYCWKSRLNSEGSDLVCNWANSAYEACKETMSSKLDKSSLVSEPVNAKRCDNGQWLVQVARR
ncbi:MAG: hypothetical protein IPP88_06925 [Betaproteobacteria bacterium]|nr:hypothetical protein [Betaproteobacteria bacterium]